MKQNQSAYMEALRSQQARRLRSALLTRLRKDAKIDINQQVLDSRSKQAAA